MSCVSPFAESFEKFTGKKSLDEFIQKQKFYVTPTQINIGFDPISQKQVHSVCTIIFNAGGNFAT